MNQTQYIPTFFVKQKLALTVNRFEVRLPTPDGQLGDLICFAEQKRFALKERVTFFADETKQRPVFSFQARNIMDLRGSYDIYDENNQVIGSFQKSFGASLLRTTYQVQTPSFQATGQERNQIVAVLRRFTDFAWPIHFDYTDPQGNTLVSIERQWALRDKYTVNVPDQRVDFRVAAALAVAMDVLIER